MPRFEPGQVWTYRTRPDEEVSRVIVCRVDSHETDNAIIHIFVEGVAIAGAHTAISHAPICEKALRESVLSLESMRESLPGYEEGYKTWQTSYDEGDAGVFTISVAECVEVIEEAWVKGR